MKLPETSSFANTERSWTYDTPYDLAMRREIIVLEGKDSRRFKDVETYIDYINNAMPEGHMIATQVVEHRIHNPYAAEASRPSRSISLYSPDQNRQFIATRYISGLNDFVGHKIILQDDDAFVVNTDYNLAVKPKFNKSVTMINTSPDNTVGHNMYNGFNRRINEIIGSYTLAQYALARF